MDNVKVITVDTNAAQKSVSDLRKELKELRGTMLSTEQGTEEFNQAMLQAAEIQHTLKEQMELVNNSAMDFGQIAGNITKSVGGMVAGFQAAKATMSLFGIENETVLKSLQKMQNMMAITQALPAIDNGVKAFKRLGIAIKGAAASMNGLKAAVVSTGIGALVVALGALVANWDKVTDAVKRFTDSNYAAKKSQEELANKIVETEKEIAAAKGKLAEWEEQQDYAKMNKKSREAFDEYKNQLEGVQLQLSVLRAEEKKAEEEMIAGASRRAKGDEWKGLKQAYNDTAEARKNAEAQVKALQQSLDDLRSAESSYTKDEEKTVNTTKEHVKTLQELIAETTAWLELQTKEGETHDAVAKALAKRRKELQELKEAEAEDEDLSNITDRIKQAYDTVASLESAFGVSREERYAQEFSALESWKRMELEKYKENEEEKTRILEQYQRLREALTQEHVEYQKEIAYQEVQVWTSIVGNIGSVLATIGDAMDENNKEQFEAAKAFNISAAVINTITGAINAYTGAAGNAGINAIPVVGPALAQALGITSAAAVAAAGAAQIAKISKTKFGDKNTNTKLSGTPSTGAVSSVIAPVQYTQDVQGASIEGAIKDTKVYVTETDISDTQNKVEVTENEAKY